MVTNLFLMPALAYCLGIVVHTIPDDIAGVADVDEPFPELAGRIVDHTSETGMRPQYLHTLPNGLVHAPRSVGVLRTQDLP